MALCSMHRGVLFLISSSFLLAAAVRPNKADPLQPVEQVKGQSALQGSIQEQRSAERSAAKTLTDLQVGMQQQFKEQIAKTLAHRDGEAGASADQETLASHALEAWMKVESTAWAAGRSQSQVDK
mmetsp:Transcript_51945/g.121622  ORF Transcript_51945/g.121622 Transcript_51945/m.121622 type:complete len:125 (+) Transcript_51945:37-411(+)